MSVFLNSLAQAGKNTATGLSHTIGGLSSATGATANSIHAATEIVDASLIASKPAGTHLGSTLSDTMGITNDATSLTRAFTHSLVDSGASIGDLCGNIVKTLSSIANGLFVNPISRTTSLCENVMNLGFDWLDKKVGKTEVVAEFVP